METTTEGRQEVRETGETTAPLADAVNQLSTLLSRVKISDGSEATISPFDGTYSATQFFQAFDRKMEDASMGEQEKLLRLPNYLARQPLELFRKLRMADRSYFQVRQILLDLYPESSEASFAKYFAMKLTGQANLETYYREKTAMGLQLGLPQEVILETLTEGLPFNDQRLVRVVPPREPRRVVPTCTADPRAQCTDNATQRRSTTHNVGSVPQHTPTPRCMECTSSTVQLQVLRRETLAQRMPTSTSPDDPRKSPDSANGPKITSSDSTTTKSSQRHPSRAALSRLRLTIDFNKCTIFQLGAPLSTLSYHFNHVSNVCTYWQCQAMSQKIFPASQLSAYDNHCVHSLRKTHLSTCPFFTKANCLFYMPSNNQTTTTSTYEPVQNAPTQRDNSHTKNIGDHTPLHNSHITNPHNELDTHTNTQQNPCLHSLPKPQIFTCHHSNLTPRNFSLNPIANTLCPQHIKPQDGFHTHNTRTHTSSHNGNTHNQPNKRDTHTKRRHQPVNTCTIVKNNTIIPSTQNIEKIHATKQPHNRKTLRSFLKAVNAYKEFIPDHARLRTPLVNLLKKDVMWVWDDERQKAFTNLKENLTTHPTLHLYQEGLPCQVYCNTSTFSITGVLKQVYPDGKTYTVQHFSRSLRSHERNYSDLEIQCLAIVESVDNFRTCLMDRKFTIFSDHPALQWLKEIKAPSGRLFRWRLRLSRYEYEVRSINGVQQYETGVGTRIPFCGFLDAPLIQSQQSSPPGKSRVTMDHNKLRTVSRKGVLKTIVPSSLTTRLLKSVHTQHHHPNISKMTRLISSQYYWQNMTQDIAKQVKTCPTCRFARRIDEYNQPSPNGTEIVTYGTKVRNLDIGLRRQFQWPFVIANTNRAIIGADFLNNFGLIIDIKNKRLIDGITNLSIRGVIQSISDMGNISTLNSSSKVSAILTKYPNLCRPPSDFVEAKHSVKHYIPTRGQPIHSKARRLDSQRLTFAKAEFQYMLNNGIIRPSNSPWASPLHLVSKKDESLRPCGDYRRLNAVTLPDRYPIPRLDDFHHILKGTLVYSKIDLCKAFYQIPIAEEDKPKTAIITPFGLFEFNVMSFGLRNATATFQRFMHEVLRNLDFAFVYLDDILVASKTEEEHYSHLETLFSRLNSYGLRINLSKSKFLVQEIYFLGYLITCHGVKPLPTKVKAILEYKKPKTVHELRIFLGMLNFYRTFLNNAAETQAILHEYLRGAKKKDRSEIKWTKEAEVQFEKCKQALANTALLAYPDTELPISLCTDASDRAVGSVLQQLDNNNWKPIAFFSKKLNPAQCNYSTYDRELLAIYLSIKFFKHLLEAREFTILTDHKPLIYAFKQKNEKASPRQLRHLQYISQFTTDIKYIKGTDNIVADALSRVDAITTIDYEEIAKEQTGDSELQNLISKNTSLKFKQCPLQSGNLLWCDVSTNNIRPFIPIKFRMMVFRNFHELSHPGIKATTKQLTSRFIWPNMNKDIRKWAQACVNCQKCKVSIHTKSEIGKYQEVDERFSVVHIDLIGALPPSNGNIYCLTCIDRYTSWMEVVPLPDMKSETVARAFYENWIVRFGAPHTVISDRGKQFTSQLFKDLTTLCGIKLRHSTAYHPQCNGKIERLHRTIKTAIRAHNSIKWTETLPTVLLGLRAAINKDNNHSLSQMVYGKTIRLPGEFFDASKHHLHAEEFVQQLQRQMELLKPLNEKHHSKTKVFVHKDLKTCSHVFIRTDRVKKPLEPPYEGPFPVLERTDKYFTLKVKGKNVTTSIDRLRPAYLLADSHNITAEHPTAARPIVSGALPSTSSQQNPDPPDVEKYTEFQGTGSAPDLPRTRSGGIIKKPYQALVGSDSLYCKYTTCLHTAVRPRVARAPGFSPLASCEMSLDMPNSASPGSPGSAGQMPGRPSIQSPTGGKISKKNEFQKIISKENSEHQEYVNPPAGVRDADLAAARVDVTAPLTAASYSATIANPASLGWGDSEMAEMDANNGYTTVGTKKRRRVSPGSPAAAAPSSGTRGAGATRRPRSSTGWAPRAEEVRTTRAYIAEARARQASSTEDHCVYIERSPELEPYHYMRALDRMLGGTREVFQMTKMNGHFLVGLANRGLAERLVNEGLEVEGTLHRAFPFRKRAERITVGNLPFFVGDAAVHQRPFIFRARRTTAPGPATPTSPTSVPPATAPRLPQQPSARSPPPASPSSTMEVSDVPPASRAAPLPPAALQPSPPAPSALPLEDTPPAPPPVTPAPSLRTPGSREPAAPTPDVEMSIVEETFASSTSSAKNATGDDLVAFIEGNPSVSFARTDALGLGREEVLDLLSSRTKAQRKGPLLSPPQCDALVGLIGQILDLKPGHTSNLYKVLGQVRAELTKTPAAAPTPPLPAPRPDGPIPPPPHGDTTTPDMATPPPPPSPRFIDERWREVHDIIYASGREPYSEHLSELRLSEGDITDAVICPEDREPLLRSLSTRRKNLLAEIISDTIERARDIHPFAPRAVLHPSAPRPSPPEAPASPMEETPSAPPPVTPAPSLQAPEGPVGPHPANSQHPEPTPPTRPDFVAPRDALPTQETLGPAAPTPDVEMSIVEETSASSTSSTRNATGDDLVAFIERNPSVSFAGTDALGLGREEVLDLLSSRTRAKKRGPLLSPPQSGALTGLIKKILDPRPGGRSNIYKVLGQVKAELRITPAAVPPTPLLPAPRPAEPMPPTTHREELTPPLMTPPPPAPTDMEEDDSMTEEERCTPPLPAPRLAEPTPPTPLGEETTLAMATPPPPLSYQLIKADLDRECLDQIRDLLEELNYQHALRPLIKKGLDINDIAFAIGRKRRRGSANSPTAAAPSSNPGGSRTIRRPQPSAGSVPRAQEIRVTRAHIAEARARQASSSEEHCVYIEHSPELEPFHYLRALDRMLGGTAGVIQITKVNGHQLLGLTNRGLAERLISEGLEVEGTLLRAFPFRKRAERITVGNLPFFVADSAVITALSPYGRVTSIAPKQMKAGPYVYVDGRRDVFITLHEGITIERLPTRLDINIKGQAWPAYLSSGIRCSRCHGQGHRRAICPLLAGLANNTRTAPPTTPAGVPPPTTPAPPQRSAAQPPAPTPSNPAMEVCSAPPVARAALHSSAPRPSPPAAPAFPMEETPPAPPPVTPAPSLQTPGSREPAAPTPDVEMSIVEETFASSTSSAKNATRVDLDAFIEGLPSVSFAKTDALGLGREEVLDLLSSRTKAQRKGPLLSPPQCDALVGLIGQILDLKPGHTSNLYKVLGQVKAELRTTPAVPPTPTLPAPWPAKPTPPALHGEKTSPDIATPPPPLSTEFIDACYDQANDIIYELSDERYLETLSDIGVTEGDIVEAIIFPDDREPLLRRLSTQKRTTLAGIVSAASERARSSDPFRTLLSLPPSLHLGGLRPSPPKQMKAGPYVYVDGRRDVFITLHEGITIERLPTRLDINIKGQAWPAYLSSGIRCSRCHGQGHRRAICPLLVGLANNTRMAPPTTPAGVPPPTTSAPPQRSAAQPPAPAPSNLAMEVCSAPPMARAVLHPSAPRPSPPAAPALPMEETPSAPPPVIPAPSLQ
ncbi:hypothetical protein LAZ67_1002684, partial [Cordylochernes scorpioides]